MFSNVIEPDNFDLLILEHLTQDARVTWAELAKRLGLSAPAIAERVRKLEENGIIIGHHTHINPIALGQFVLAFIAVALHNPKERAKLEQCIFEQTCILECHHTTGADDYFLKVRVANPSALEELISKKLKHVAPSIRTHTTIVLSSLKETVLQVRS
jgi:Lrp/AsnC family transcriptional regulator, leucine-responsive regulatory protein